MNDRYNEAFLSFKENGEIEVPVSIEVFDADMETVAWIAQGGEVELSWPEMMYIPKNWSVIFHDYTTGNLQI